MYRSHPVRRMREEPFEGESVTLVVEFDADGDTQATREAIEALADEHGGAIECDLRFADLAVSLPETAVADLCALDGLARIETDRTLSLSPPGVEE